MIHHIQSIDKEKFKFGDLRIESYHFSASLNYELNKLMDSHGDIVVYNTTHYESGTFVLSWAPIEPIQESDELKLDLPPDPSALNTEEKKAVADTTMQSAGELLLTIFYYLGLKTHMAARLHEPSTNEYFELVFRKVDGPQLGENLIS